MISFKEMREEVLGDLKKFKYRGTSLSETRSSDYIKDAFREAELFEKVKEQSVKKPFLKELMDKSPDDINTLCLCLAEHQIETLYSLVSVMTSQHTKQLEVNLKQKILVDLKQFFNSANYLKNGYNKDLQKLLDIIYNDMVDWFYSFEYKESINNPDDCEA